MTSVVNLYKDSYDVYIGRAGKGRDGPLGNPIVPGQDCPICDKVHANGGETLPCFERYLICRITDDPEFKALIESCRGKKLGCFCKPKPCHGDVIVKYLEESNET